jgi:two-component system alkaline phosphatase synthesis response regulator PhoP
MGKPEYRILLIDDEPDILEILSFNLNKTGYNVITSLNAREGIEIAREYQPHLILMDVMMPGMDGIEACEQMRSIDALKDTVIAFITARTEDYSQVAGFEAGADDYIAKPVNLKVLSNRIKALLKRFGDNHSGTLRELPSHIINLGDLEIDREKYVIKIQGKEMLLPKKEFELLLLLSSKPGKVFTRESIFTHIWGDDVVVGDRTIDVHIRKLREKIGEGLIVTIKGVGYKFKE